MYLITTKNGVPFFTKWFNAENDFNKDVGMIVYNIINMKYSVDGETWNDIEIDHL